MRLSFWIWHLEDVGKYLLIGTHYVGTLGTWALPVHFPCPSQNFRLCLKILPSTKTKGELSCIQSVDVYFLSWENKHQTELGDLLFLGGVRELMVEYGNDFVNKVIFSFLVLCLFFWSDLLLIPKEALSIKVAHELFSMGKGSSTRRNEPLFLVCSFYLLILKSMNDQINCVWFPLQSEDTSVVSHKI